MDELDVLHDVATRLEEASIPYMLTGSMALNYYAEPRMTRDIDLVVDVREEEVSPLVSTFRPEYYVPQDAIETAVRQRSMFNLIHRESVLKIAFVLRKDTRYREVEFDRRQRVKLGPAEVYVVRKEDLIISKIAWAEDSQSDVQKRDVRNLMATGYDEDYLEHWLNELDLHDVADSWPGISDTTPQMQDRQRELLMARSNEERFRMGISMCQTARPDSRRDGRPSPRT